MKNSNNMVAKKFICLHELITFAAGWNSKYLGLPLEYDAFKDKKDQIQYEIGRLYAHDAAVRGKQIRQIRIRDNGRSHWTMVPWPDHVLQICNNDVIPMGVD